MGSANRQPPTANHNMLSKHSLTKSASLMFAATTVVNVLNYVFHIFMGRALGPADYGVLASLVSLLTIASVPATSIQTLITKYVATLSAHNRFGSIKFFLIKLAQKIALVGVPAMLVFTIISKYVASFLGISSSIPVLLMGGVVFLSFYSTLTLGALQGLQNFWHLAINLISGALTKLFFGVLLVYLGFGVNGSVIAYAISGSAMIIIALYPLRLIMRENSTADGIDAGEVKQYFWPVMVMILCFTAMTNIDVVMVKHYFKPTEAGYYAAAAIFGKIVLFVPGAIAMVMFPRVAQLNALKHDTRDVLIKSLLVVGALCGLVTLAYFTFPKFIVTVMFGMKYADAIPLMGLFGIAMMVFALINILGLYSLSIQDFKVIWLMFGGVLLEALLLILFHNTLRGLLVMVIASGFIVLIPALTITLQKHS